MYLISATNGIMAVKSVHLFLDLYTGSRDPFQREEAANAILGMRKEGVIG
jgi:hypothetical protein